MAPQTAALPNVRSASALSAVDVHTGSFSSIATATTATALADNFVLSAVAGRLDSLDGHTGSHRRQYGDSAIMAGG